MLMLKYHMPNQFIKFEVSSFSCSGDILGGSKKLNGSHNYNYAPFGDDFLFVFKVIVSNVHLKSGSISGTELDRDTVTTGH